MQKGKKLFFFACAVDITPLVPLTLPSEPKTQSQHGGFALFHSNTCCGWLKSISHHIDSMVEINVCCFFTGDTSFQGFLGGVRNPCRLFDRRFDLSGAFGLPGFWGPKTRIAYRVTTPESTVSTNRALSKNRLSAVVVVIHFDPGLSFASAPWGAKKEHQQISSSVRFPFKSKRGETYS